MRVPRLLGISEFRRRLPTTDLYFLNPLRHLAILAAGANLPPVRHLFGHVYAVGRTGVISRYASEPDLERLQGLGIRRIVYIADDDFEAGAADPSLPPGYRDKLAAFAAGSWPALRMAADVVVASGPVIGRIYGGKARVIAPVWHRAPAGCGHFARPATFEIAHMGTASHLADLAPLAPALAAILQAHPQARLTLFAGAAAPGALRGLRRVRSWRPMPWWRYKLLLPRYRFHLAIYPLRESPFNAARSANKLFEQALVGAASLMTPNPALRDAAGAAGDALFVEGGPDEWRRRIEADLADVVACGRRAEGMRAHILATDPPGHAARQWREILADEFG